MRNNLGGGSYGDMRGWHGGWWQFSSRVRNDVGMASVRFADAPPSWTEMATNPDPRLDSFAVAVWGALREYDWTALTPKEVTQ